MSPIPAVVKFLDYRVQNHDPARQDAQNLSSKSRSVEIYYDAGVRYEDIRCFNR
jgi:hypothetical protein